MYEDLIKKLRYCGNAISCPRCPYWEGCGGSKEDLSQAADVIEELSYKYEKALSDLVKGNKLNWFPIAERLPEKTGHYLVNIKCPRGKWIEICSFDGSEWESVDDYADIATKWVTHWMPLPEPPEEE